MTIATPFAWTYEGSLSQQHKVSPGAEAEDRLVFLRFENGVSVYLDIVTNEDLRLRP